MHSAIAEKRDLYDFAKTLGQLGLQLVDKFGSNSDKWYVMLPLKKRLVFNNSLATHWFSTVPW